MLGYAVIFFLLAIVAAVFGFGGVAGTLSAFAQFFAILFVVLFVASLLYGIITESSTNSPY